jgi:putative transposase
VQSELPQRKSLRLRDYDYSREGIYFITICTQRRVWALGELWQGKFTQGPIGEIAFNCWQELPLHFPNISTIEFIVMPDHVHGIISIDKSREKGAIYCAPTKNERIAPGSLGTIIRSYKGAVTRILNRKFIAGFTPLWQRGYYEHITRNQKELDMIIEYIKTNPQNWEKDWYPD